MLNLKNIFSKTTRFSAANLSKSSDLLLRSGFVSFSSVGHTNYHTLGLKALERIKCVVRAEMDELSSEMSLSLLQDAAWWKESGRMDAFGKETVRVLDRSDKTLVLGATAEEAFVMAAKDMVTSYKDLSFSGYQIGAKFRDEIRTRGGLMRSREFIMKDAYSLHLTEEDAAAAYEEYKAAYFRIFARLGAEVMCKEADSGAMGGKSHEFLAFTEDGDDTVDGRRAAEVGHIFQLGTRYTDALGLKVKDNTGTSVSVYMNCYGIGISRTLAVLAAQNADEHGMQWSCEAAFANVHVISASEQNNAAGEALGRHLDKAFRVVVDTRSIRAGQKFHDADLLGASIQVILGRGYADGYVEVKDRKTGERTDVAVEHLQDFLRKKLT